MGCSSEVHLSERQSSGKLEYVSTLTHLTSVIAAAVADQYKSSTIEGVRARTA